MTGKDTWKELRDTAWYLPDGRALWAVSDLAPLVGCSPAELTDAALLTLPRTDLGDTWWIARPVSGDAAVLVTWEAAKRVRVGKDRVIADRLRWEFDDMIADRRGRSLSASYCITDECCGGHDDLRAEVEYLSERVRSEIPEGRTFMSEADYTALRGGEGAPKLPGLAREAERVGDRTGVAGLIEGFAYLWPVQVWDAAQWRLMHRVLLSVVVADHA